MAIPHPGLSRGVWIIFLLGMISSIFYSIAVIFLTIFPHLFNTGWRSYIAEWWAIVGGAYICLQIAPIISRPVNKDAWEITDHLTSWIPVIILVGAFPAIWLSRGEWPDYWTWKIYWAAVAIGLADVMLTFVSLKISRHAQRITPA